LANGEAVKLSDSQRNNIVIRLVVNFPNFVSAPLPTVPANIALSNPFDLVVVDDSLYVSDGGRNLVWEVDLETKSFSRSLSFPTIPNPLFPGLGGPVLQAVPRVLLFLMINYSSPFCAARHFLPAPQA
jgi:hypothetical protein